MTAGRRVSGSQRDKLKQPDWTQGAVILVMNRAAGWIGGSRREAAGTQWPEGPLADTGIGAACNITALVSDPGSKANAQTRRCEPHRPIRAS
jgi:hypothetical protein